MWFLSFDSPATLVIELTTRLKAAPPITFLSGPNPTSFEFRDVAYPREYLCHWFITGATVMLSR